MRSEFCIVYSVSHSQLYKDEEKLADRMDDLAAKTELRWSSKWDSDGRVIMFPLRDKQIPLRRQKENV